MPERINLERLGMSFSEALKQVGLSDEAITLASTAALGGRELLRWHGLSDQELRTRIKVADSTPVTVADEGSERRIRFLLKRALPHCAVWGEEFGRDNRLPSQKSIWADPLDGTGEYTRGYKNGTVGLAIRSEIDGVDQPTSAVICMPFDKRLVLAEKGKGAHLLQLSDKLVPTAEPSRPIHVSSKNSFDRVFVARDGNNYPKARSHQRVFEDGLLALAPTGNIVFMSPLSNLAQQAYVAMGMADVGVTDHTGGPYDHVGELIIQEAGGLFTDQYGNPITDETQVSIYGNPALQPHLVEIAKRAYDGYTGFQ